ncbi:MAG: hypothetical protein AAFQ22_12540 [Pseudomonadota bacterium]
MDIFEELTESLLNNRKNHEGAKAITLLAKSPNSPVAKQIWRILPALKEANCTVHVVFTTSRNRKSLQRAIEQYNSVFDGVDGAERIRLLDDGHKKETFESVQLGDEGLWTGDHVASWFPSKPKAEEFLRELDAETAALFRSTFSMLWSSASDIAA